MSKRRFEDLPIATKLSLAQAGLVVAVLAALSLGQSAFVGGVLERRATDDLDHQSARIVDAVSSLDASLRGSADALGRLFASGFPGRFAIDPTRGVEVDGRRLPLLTHDGSPVHGVVTWLERFTSASGAVATVFARDGEEFVRVATTLKDGTGKRALGTVLDHAHPAYRLVREGATYLGTASLFGRDYMTRYEPVRDAQGSVVGILFVGLDFTEGLAGLRDRIRSVKVGKTGYAYVLDARPGPGLGRLLVHPASEGKVILDSKDASGRPFIREILQARSGIARYPWQNAALGETHPRDKVVAYRYFEPWGWVVAVGVTMDELTAERLMVRNALLAGAIVVVALLVAVSW
jgi:methyl-accepting chemotaxis protein-2 (aspartate sensor receptor)